MPVVERSKTVTVQWPAGGFSENLAYADEDLSMTDESLNVRNFGAQTDRLTGGQRPGLGKYDDFLFVPPKIVVLHFDTITTGDTVNINVSDTGSNEVLNVNVVANDSIIDNIASDIETDINTNAPTTLTQCDITTIVYDPASHSSLTDLYGGGIQPFVEDSFDPLFKDDVITPGDIILIISPCIPPVQIAVTQEDSSGRFVEQGAIELITLSESGDRIQQIDDIVSVRDPRSVEPKELLFEEDFSGYSDGQAIDDGDTTWAEYVDTAAVSATEQIMFENAVSASFRILAEGFTQPDAQLALRADIDSWSSLSQNSANAIALVSTGFQDTDGVSHTFLDTDKYVVEADVQTITTIDAIPNTVGWKMATGIAFRCNISGTNSEWFTAGWQKASTVDDYYIAVMWNRRNSVGEVQHIVARTEVKGGLDNAVHKLRIRVNGNFVEVDWDGVTQEFLAEDDSAIEDSGSIGQTYAIPPGFRQKFVDLADAPSINASGVSYNQLAAFWFRHMDDDGPLSGWPDMAERPKIHAFRVYSAEQVVSAPRKEIVVVAGGTIFVGRKGDWRIPNGGLNALDPNVPTVETVVGILGSRQEMFFCDKRNYKRLDPVGNTVVDWVADEEGGSLPGDVPEGSTDQPTLDKCGIVVSWGGHIVMSGKAAEPHNVFGLVVGNPLNANFIGDIGDPTAAWALNASNLGELDDVVTGLIPYHRTGLLIGGDHSFYRLSGHPLLAGASLNALTRDIGLLGQRAWCQGPNRVVYAMCTDGLHRISPNTFSVDETTRVSAGRLDKTFGELNRRTNLVELEYDTTTHLVHIFITPFETTSTVHYVYDTRADAFFAESYPNDQGPTSAHVFDSDLPADRALLLGGRDGYIRNFVANKPDDDGTLIQSYCRMGPYTASGDTELSFTRFDVVLNEDSGSGMLEVRVGDTAQSALSASATIDEEVTSGRNNAIRSRARGHSMYVTIRNKDVTMIDDAQQWTLDGPIYVKGVQKGTVRKR